MVGAGSLYACRRGGGCVGSGTNGWPVRKRASPTHAPSCAGCGGAAGYRVALRQVQLAQAGAATVGPSGCVGVFFLVEGVAGEEDGAVKFVGETAVAAADLHGDDDEFGEDVELPGERGVHVGVAEGKTDGAVCGDDFEEDGEECEGVLIRVGELVAFDNGDDEQSQGNVP